jgi:hypothetical protein
MGSEEGSGGAIPPLPPSIALTLGLSLAIEGVVVLVVVAVVVEVMPTEAALGDEGDTMYWLTANFNARHQ